MDLEAAVKVQWGNDRHMAQEAAAKVQVGATLQLGLKEVRSQYVGETEALLQITWGNRVGMDLLASELCWKNDAFVM